MRSLVTFDQIVELDPRLVQFLNVSRQSISPSGTFSRLAGAHPAMPARVPGFFLRTQQATASSTAVLDGSGS